MTEKLFMTPFDLMQFQMTLYGHFLDAIASQEILYKQVTYSLTHLVTELKSYFTSSLSTNSTDSTN